jgi:hypothetical protein
MKKLDFTIALLLSIFLFYSCDDKGTATDDASDEIVVNTTPPPTTLPVTPIDKTLPSIPKEKVKELWDNAHSIDYIMTNLPFSLSTSDFQQSRAMLQHISIDSSIVYPDCGKTATISYVGDEGILMEADLYYSLTDSRCNYFIFYQNGQPAYANRLTEQGYNYYQQIVTQVKVEQGNANQ